MAGVETQYAPGLLTTSDPHNHQALAPGYRIGMRFPSDQVLRLADAKPVHLGHILNADGRWRILLFSPETQDPTSPSSTLWETCAYLETALIPRYVPRLTSSTSEEGEGEGEDIDSQIDIRAILPLSRQDLPITSLPPLLLPKKGRFGIQDYEKVFTDEPSYGFGFGEVFRKRGP
ncbi:hypothetical protein KC366_g16829 [Hortaea werneckii]|nr:hypothetical protein KC366_g16829 [Hortaea werneckii]